MEAEALTCVECQGKAEGRAVGWQGHLADVDDVGELDLVLYCPVCAERESGEASPAARS